MERKAGGLAALALVLLLLSSCAGYQEVAFKGITDMELERLDAQGVQARVHVTLENPNPFRIHVLDPDVDLFLNEVYIGKATLDSALVLDKRSERTYAVPLHASFGGHGAQAMGAMLTAALTGKATLRAKGSVAGRAFLVRKRFPFEEERSFDLAR